MLKGRKYSDYPEIKCLVSAISSDSAAKNSGLIREMIFQGEIPVDLIAEISGAVKNIGKDKSYAVRSSATGEDLPQASFAGQLETYLNVQGEKEILVSLI